MGPVLQEREAPAGRIVVDEGQVLFLFRVIRIRTGRSELLVMVVPYVVAGGWELTPAGA